MAQILEDAVYHGTQGTMVTYVSWDVPFQWNFELRFLGVALGIGEWKTHSTMMRGVEAKNKGEH